MAAKNVDMCVCVGMCENMSWTKEIKKETLKIKHTKKLARQRRRRRRVVDSFSSLNWT